jgi:hypothetical protein
VTAAAPHDIRHSAASACWYTPPEIVDAARELMGGIDLDPASDAAGNAVVRAERIFTDRDNGLRRSWSGRIWLNPPTPPKEWWAKLSQSWAAAPFHVKAVYLAYSIEQIQQSQLWAEREVASSMLSHPVCFPKRRITFYRTAGDASVAIDKLMKRSGETSRLRAERGRLAELPPTTLVKGDSPAHASAIVGVGLQREAFRAAYSWLGECP